MHHYTTLIDVATLGSQLDRSDLVLFDCRFDLGNVHWGETEYASAHLPGAFYLHLDRDLSGPIAPTSGRQHRPRQIGADNAPPESRQGHGIAGGAAADVQCRAAGPAIQLIHRDLHQPGVGR